MKCCPKVLLSCLLVCSTAALAVAQPKHYKAKFLADVTGHDLALTQNTEPIGVRKFTNSGTVVFGDGTAFYHGGALKLASQSFGAGKVVVTANSSDEFGVGTHYYECTKYASSASGPLKDIFNYSGSETYRDLTYTCLGDDGTFGGTVNFGNAWYNAKPVLSNVRTHLDNLSTNLTGDHIGAVLDWNTYGEVSGNSASGSISSRLTLNGTPGPSFPALGIKFIRSDGALILQTNGNGERFWMPGNTTPYFSGAFSTSCDLANVVAFTANYEVPHMLGYNGFYIELKSITTGLPANCRPYSSFIREDGEIATLVEQGGKLALYQLTPVPEMSSLAAVLAGICTLTILPRKSKKRNSPWRVLYTTFGVISAPLCMAAPTVCKPIWNTIPVVRDVLFAMPARNLLVCSSDDGILVINPRHRNVVWRIGDYESGDVTDVVGSRFIAGLSPDYQPVIYDVDTFATVFAPSSPKLFRSRLSLDGKVMVGMNGTKAYVYSVTQKILTKSFTIGTSDWVVPNYDGTLVYSAQSSGVLDLYNASTGAKIGSSNLFASGYAGLRLSPNGQHLVALSRNGWLVDVVPNTVNVSRTVRANTSSYNTWLSISADSTLVSVSGDIAGSTIRALSDFSAIYTFGGNHHTSAFLSQDREFLMTKYVDGQYVPYIAIVKSPSTPAPFMFIPGFAFPTNYGSIFSFSPDGNSFLMNWPGSYSYPTQFGTMLINPLTGLGDYQIPGLTAYAQLTAQSQPNGTQYITGNSDWRIRVYQDNSASAVAELATHGAGIRQLCYDQSGNKFAAVSDDNLVSVWDAKTLTLKTIFPTPEFEWKPDVSFSPDGNSLYLVKNHVLRKYDLSLGTPIWSWNQASQCIVSPDGNHIAVGGVSPSLLSGSDGSVVSTLQSTSGGTVRGYQNSFWLTTNSSTVVESRSFVNGSVLGQIALQRGPSFRYGMRYGGSLLGSSDGRLLFSASNGNAMYRNPWYPSGMTCRAIVDVDQYFGPFSRFKADIQFLDPSTGQIVYSESGIEDLFGDYRANTEAQRGVFDIRIKCGTGLAKVIKGVDFAAGTEVLEVQLTNGDIDGDNYVGTDDYLLLSAAFDSKPSDNDWLATADLDGDDFVGTNDYLILSNAFDTYGD